MHIWSKECSPNVNLPNITVKSVKLKKNLQVSQQYLFFPIREVDIDLNTNMSFFLIIKANKAPRLKIWILASDTDTQYVRVQGVPKNVLIEQNHNQKWVLWG